MRKFLTDRWKTNDSSVSRSSSSSRRPGIPKFPPQKSWETEWRRHLKKNSGLDPFPDPASNIWTYNRFDLTTQKFLKPYVNLKMWQHGAHNCLIYYIITRSFIFLLHCCEIDNIIDEESNFFPDQNFGSTLFRISLSLNLYILLTHLISYGVLRSCIVAINTLPQ